jgi:hypothetical protein
MRESSARAADSGSGWGRIALSGRYCRFGCLAASWSSARNKRARWAARQCSRRRAGEPRTKCCWNAGAASGLRTLDQLSAAIGSTAHPVSGARTRGLATVGARPLPWIAASDPASDGIFVPCDWARRCSRARVRLVVHHFARCVTWLSYQTNDVVSLKARRSPATGPDQIELVTFRWGSRRAAGSSPQ